MKSKILFSSLLAFAATAFVGCNEAAVDQVQPSLPTNACTLVANVPTTQTRISFTDNSAEGIALAWAEGDTFSVYEAEGAWVEDFTISNLSSATFTAVNGTSLTEGVDYIAVYPARDGEATYADYAATDLTSSQSQSGSLGHLNAACVMEDTFTYGESVAFAHTKAIMTISFESAATPTKLVFTDAAVKSYELYLSEADADADTYTAYMMIEPVEVAAERTLDFVVAYNDAEAQAYSAESAVSYVAGYRYTAPVAASSTTGYTAIYTAEQLVAYLASPTTNAALMNDIDLDGYSFFPNTSAYSKTFNGNGYTISNFACEGVDDPDTDNDESQNVAMFRSASSAAVIKNLNFVNPVLSGVKYVAVVVGDNSATISNCSVTGGDISATLAPLAGIAGQNRGTVSGCSYYGTVASESGNLGGIVGYNEGGKIVGCVSGAEVTSSGTNTGGVCGASLNSGYISDCEFAVEGIVTVNAAVECAGGIVGKSDSGTSVVGCISRGSVTSQGKHVGGIVGYGVSVTVLDCVNYSTVQCFLLNLGGIVGNGSGTITGCVNYGIIANTAESVSSNTGGIMGTGSATVSGCVNRGQIDGYKCSGGIVGYASGVIAACYNEGEMLASIRVGGIAGELTATANLVGCYNFGSISTANGFNGQIAGTSNDGYVITDCYYVGSSTKDYGTSCSSISELNEKVENMNDAINTLVEGEVYEVNYIFVEGADPTVDVPTIVAR